LKRDGKLRVAVLSSRRSPGLSELLSHGRESGLYEVVCLLTSEESFAGRGVAALAGVPILSHPIRVFCQQRGRRFTDLSLRETYDAETVERLRPFAPDALLFSSYLLIATEPLLAAWPDRIVNVHGSDLARTGPGGRPLYAGLRAVRDAIRAGETETRATAHIVTESLDDGPILLQSEAFPVAPFVARLRHDRAEHAINAYAYAHQEWMLASAWGSLLSGSAEILAAAGLVAPRLAEDASLVLRELA
jgi:folate-dependent phosphoribosylglycinamide formyltransferase PurN